MELIFATQNQNKAEEIQKLMPKGIHVKSLKDIGCMVDIPETADTLEGNAIQKAKFVAEKYNVNCFADDTGLEVNSLNNEPGVYSARYAGEDKNADANMDLLLEKLKHKTNRQAQFRTAIALIVDGKLKTFEGKVEGVIRKEKSGKDGFGYDPIFEPEKRGITFAEMELSEKNKISHRGRAIQKMIKFLRKENE
jgi:XTP/dITP diphosphohydrolase